MSRVESCNDNDFGGEGGTDGGDGSGGGDDGSIGIGDSGSGWVEVVVVGIVVRWWWR